MKTETLGSVLLTAQAQHKHSATKAAEALGVHRITYGRWVKDEAQPMIENRAALAEYTGRTIAELNDLVRSTFASKTDGDRTRHRAAAGG